MQVEKKNLEIFLSVHACMHLACTVSCETFRFVSEQCVLHLAHNIDSNWKEDSPLSAILLSYTIAI